MPQETDTQWVVRLGGAAAVIFMAFGGSAWISDYIWSKQTHEMLVSLYYTGEWTVGEYRECVSGNLKDQGQDPPLIVCELPSFDSSPKIFKAKFTGPMYDPKVKDGGETTARTTKKYPGCDCSAS